MTALFPNGRAPPAPVVNNDGTNCCSTRFQKVTACFATKPVSLDRRCCRHPTLFIHVRNFQHYAVNLIMTCALRCDSRASTLKHDLADTLEVRLRGVNHFLRLTYKDAPPLFPDTGRCVQNCKMNLADKALLTCVTGRLPDWFAQYLRKQGYNRCLWAKEMMLELYHAGRAARIPTTAVQGGFILIIG